MKGSTDILDVGLQRRSFERARERAGLPDGLRFHDLKHAFASMAAHRGVDKQVLSDVMGHAHVGVTDSVYKHLYDGQSAEDAFRKAMGTGRRLDVRRRQAGGR
jgi:integrase